MILLRNWNKRVGLCLFQPDLVLDKIDAASIDDVDAEGLNVKPTPYYAGIVSRNVGNRFK